MKNETGLTGVAENEIWIGMTYEMLVAMWEKPTSAIFQTLEMARNGNGAGGTTPQAAFMTIVKTERWMRITELFAKT